jgi:hypothetical protein
MLVLTLVIGAAAPSTPEGSKNSLGFSIEFAFEPGLPAKDMKEAEDDATDDAAEDFGRGHELYCNGGDASAAGVPDMDVDVGGELGDEAGPLPLL